MAVKDIRSDTATSTGLSDTEALASSHSQARAWRRGSVTWLVAGSGSISSNSYQGPGGMWNSGLSVIPETRQDMDKARQDKTWQDMGGCHDLIGVTVRDSLKSLL